MGVYKVEESNVLMQLQNVLRYRTLSPNASVLYFFYPHLINATSKKKLVSWYIWRPDL